MISNLLPNQLVQKFLQHFFPVWVSFLDWGALEVQTRRRWHEITCNQNQLLSASLAIQRFAIKLFTINSVAITLIFDQASFAIWPQLLMTHLLSSLTCYQANLLSILGCNQQFCYHSSFAIEIFDFLLILIFTLKICKKNGKISQHLELFILWQTV